jgi:hypothetical protein
MAAGLLKFKAPPTFSGKTGEDPADWIDRYEVLADYNRWSDDDKRLNFGIYMEGPARQWFQCLTPPTQWADTAAVAAAQGTAATPAVVGMRSVFTKEFLQDSYAGYQENKLRNRKQGANEPAAEYYYEVMNLCRLIDPNMTEAAKIHHLYQGLKRTLVEKIWVLQPKTCEFLATIRRHTEATDIAQNQGWAVHTLATDKEEARVAAISREQQSNKTKETPSLKQLLEVVQQLQGEIIAMKKRPPRRDRPDNKGPQYNTQNNQTTTPQKTADGRPICFYCKEDGHIKRYCPKKKIDDETQNNTQRNTTVALMSTSDDECEKEIPLLKIDVAQLLVENVTIGKDGAEREIEAVIDSGAAVSIVSPRKAADLALELKTRGRPSIVTVNGQQTPPLGRVELSLTIGTKSIKADLLVLEMRGIDVLLGNDVLRRFKTLKIEYGTGKPKMRFGEPPVSLVLEDPHTGPTNKIIGSKGIRIPARSMAAVEVVQIQEEEIQRDRTTEIIR